MSSGLPMRRTGVCSMCLSVSPRKPLLFGLAQHGRVDEARRHGIDRDAARGQYSSASALGQAVHRGLGRDIGRHEGLARMRAGRRDVDDATPAGLEHVGQRRLDAVEHAVEVDVDDPLPLLERDRR